MSEEPRRSKGTDSPMCKLCNHRHRFADPHIFGSKPPAPSIRTVASPSGKASGFGPDTVGSNPAATAKPRRAKGGAKRSASPKPPLSSKREIVDALEAGTISPLAGAVAALSIDVKPRKPRKSDMVAKDGTNRGRPKGDKPFDKKTHDRLKAKERRDRAKANAEKAGTP